MPATGLPAQRRGRVVRAGGLVIVRQRPETAAHLLFLTLEDETGLANALVDAATYERLRPVLRGEPLLALEGPLQVRDGVTQIAVRRAWPLARPTAAPGPMVRSHDFR